VKLLNWLCDVFVDESPDSLSSSAGLYGDVGRLDVAFCMTPRELAEKIQDYYVLGDDNFSEMDIAHVESLLKKALEEAVQDDASRRAAVDFAYEESARIVERYAGTVHGAGYLDIAAEIRRRKEELK
jgi:hypothetical protein